MIATLFDFNGVLVDDEGVHLEAFRDVVRPLGLTITDDAYRDRYLGFDDFGAFRAILEDGGQAASTERVRELVDAKKPAYMARALDDLRIFAGAIDLVRRRLSRGPVGIVSGALADEIAFGLRRMGFDTNPFVIVSAESTSAGKPDPSQYLLAKSRMPEGARIVTIEDSMAGIASARGASIGCIGVTHTYPAAALAEAGADAVKFDLGSITDEVLDGAAR